MSAQQKPAAAAFRLVAADELGLLKVVEVPAGPKWDEAAVVANWGTPDRKAAVSVLASTARSWEPASPSLLAVGRLGGGVQVLDGASGAQLAGWAAAGEQRNSGNGDAPKVAGLHFLGALGGGRTAAEAAAEGRLRVLSVASGGRVSVHAAGGAGAPWEATGSFQAAPAVACSAVSADRAVLAVGGEGCQLSLWDLAAQSKAWQAKGGKPNSIGLVDQAYVTAAAFVPSDTPRPGAAGGGGGEGASCSVGRRIVVAGNTSHKVLLYDTAAGRRPQMEVPWREARITALAADDASHRVWAANGAGHIEALDLRAGRMSGTLKGAAGSVRALAMHPGGEAMVASVGLDRFVRVHSTGTRANLGRAYTKQQLTAVAWLPPLAAAAAPAAAGEAGGEDAGGEAAAEDGGRPKGRKQAAAAQAARKKQRRRQAGSEDEESSSDDSDDSDSDDSDGGGGSDDDSSDSGGSGDEGKGKRQMRLGGGRGGGGKRRGGGRGRRGGNKRRK